jgi:uncharacterized protein
MDIFFNLFAHNLLPTSLGITSLGLTVGLVLGATGAGGAILSVPLLTLALGLSVNQASPIGLLAVTVASALAAGLGLRDGIVRYKAAALMATLGLLLSPLGFYAAHQLPNAPLVALFAGLLVWVAVRMWRSAKPATGVVHASAPASTPPASTFACEQDSATGKFVWTLPCARALALTGAMAGFLSGLVGVGGGFVIVPSLKANTNLAMASIVATSLTVIAIVSAGGVALAAWHGAVDWRIAIPFTLGTVLGMLGGRGIAKRVQGQLLARGFAVLAILAGLLMLGKLISTF